MLDKTEDAKPTTFMQVLDDIQRPSSEKQILQLQSEAIKTLDKTEDAKPTTFMQAFDDIERLSNEKKKLKKITQD